MDYQRQIEIGLDFIEEHLTVSFELQDVSRAANVSHWHFQRMFKALTHETLMSYIRGRRLDRARVELATTSRPVIDIAIEAGFDSQASFTRAFKRAFGEPPGRHRSNAPNPIHLEKLRIDADYLTHLSHGVSLTPEITKLGPMHLVGLSTPFYSVDSERNNLGEKLPPLWGEFVDRASEVAERIGGPMYGLVQASPQSEMLHYLAAVEVQSEPRLGDLGPGLTYRYLPATTYARFEHRGPAKVVDQTVNYIYSNWLLQSGRRHSFGPDLETYDDRWNGSSPESVMDYAVPIEP